MHTCRITGPVGTPLLSWLHTLLLQPQHKLQRLMAGFTDDFSAEPCGPYSGSSTSTCYGSLKSRICNQPPLSPPLQQQQQQQQQGSADTRAAAAAASPEPMEVEEQLPAAANAAATATTVAEQGCNTKSTAAAAAGARALDVLRVASLQALAAYNALAVCIFQQKLHAVIWLLQQLQQDSSAAAASLQESSLLAGNSSSSSSSSVAGGPSAQQVLVAQQRIAWAGLITGQQVPLLLLAHLTGNAAVVQVRT
jgi:hypothetical protein